MGLSLSLPLSLSLSKDPAVLKSRFALVPDAVSVLHPEEMIRCDKHSSNILEVEFERAVQK